MYQNRDGERAVKGKINGEGLNGGSGMWVGPWRMEATEISSSVGLCRSELGHENQHEGLVEGRESWAASSEQGCVGMLG